MYYLYMHQTTLEEAPVKEVADSHLMWAADSYTYMYIYIGAYIIYIHTDYIGRATDKGGSWQPSDVGSRLGRALGKGLCSKMSLFVVYRSLSTFRGLQVSFRES